MSSCYINKKVSERNESDKAFMGFTHALSAIAAFLSLMAYAPDFFNKLFGSNDLWVIILACIATAGASLLPDLDNTSSTARNSLGLLGLGLSMIFRGSSTVLQTVIRTRRDDPTPDPHRGAWHTVPAALFLGFLTWAATRIGGSLTLPVVGEITYGKLSALILAFIMLHLLLSGIAKDFLRSIEKSNPFGEILSFLVSFVFTLAIFINLPKDLDFWWLGISVAFGCFIHVLGDCFTTSGAPILFPVSAALKGKFWWNTRFTSIKAGGIVEKFIFTPIFTIIIIISLIKVFS